jgi:serine/threonine-protein kinase
VAKPRRRTRADLWAFGAVFIEMLAGHRAFEGDEVSEVLASVLKTEPDWSALPSDLPAPVRRLLRRCLEKDPKKRLRDVAEGLLQMDEGFASAGPASSADRTAAAAAPPQARPIWRRALPIAVAVLLTAGAAAGLQYWMMPAPVTADPVRFVIETSVAGLFSTTTRRDLAVSRTAGCWSIRACRARARLVCTCIGSINSTPRRSAAQRALSRPSSRRTANGSVSSPPMINPF